jgi:hypothetical protein
MRHKSAGGGILRAIAHAWCVVAGLLGLLAPAAMAETAPTHVRGLSIAQITPVSRAGLSNNRYDFTYRVTLRNDNVGAYDVQAELTTTDSRYDVRDGVARWDLVPSDAQADAKGTVTVRGPAAFDARFNASGKPVALPRGAAQPAIETSVFRWKLTASRDGAGPVITDVQPTGKVSANQRNLDIQARYKDEGAGVDRASVRLFMNGHDLSARAQAGNAKVDLDLPRPTQGRHSLRLEVADKLGNRSQREWSFVYGKATTGGVGALPQLLVVDYEPVSKTLVNNTAGPKRQYLYTYRVVVRNSGGAAADVTGTLTSRRGRVQVMDAQVGFGPVGAKRTKTSVDTFTVRAGPYFDRRLDRKVSRNGVTRYEQDGDDEDDKGLRGLGKLHGDWPGGRTHAWYFLKFSLIFDWKLQASAGGSAPVIAATGPQGVTTTTAPFITAAYRDDAGVATARVRLSVDGVDVTPASQITATALSYAATGLAQGPHTAVLTVPDNAGNTTTASWAFTIDSIAPEISAPLPAAGSTVAPGVPIAARFADTGVGLDIGGIRLLIDGQDVTERATVAADGITYTPPQPLAGGAHSVQLTVPDTAGNVAQTQWAFAVDAAAPAPSNLQPAQGAELAANAVPTVAASYANDGVGMDVARIRLLVDGQDVTAQAQVTATGITWRPAAPLAEGAHVVRLVLVKRNGLTSDTSWSFTTRTPPEITAMAPRDVVLNANASVTVTAQYSDVGAGVDADKVTLTLDGVDVSEDADITPNALSWVPDAPLPQGIHVLVLTVTDKAGNSTAQSWRFTLDTGLPTISNESPRNLLPGGGTPTISAQFQDAGDSASGIDPARVQLLFNGVDVTAQAQVNTTATPGTIRYTPATALPAGTYSVKLVVGDRGGNLVESSWGFSIGEPSTVVIGGQTPRDVFLPAGTAPVIRASYSDGAAAIDPANVRLYVNDADVTAQATVDATGISYTPAQPLPDGTYRVRLALTDAAGKLAGSEWQFGIAQPPEVTAMAPKDVLLPAGAQPVITASYRDLRVGVDPASVRLIVNSQDVTAQSVKTPDSISYTPPQPLAAGPYTVYLEVANTTNAAANAVWGFEVDEARVYGLAITSPAGAQSVVQPRMTVTAVASANKTYPVRLTLNGRDMQATGATPEGATVFTGEASLADGTNTLAVLATYDDGQTRAASTQVGYDAPPRITITSPQDKAVLGPVNPGANVPGGATNLTGDVQRPVTVTGRLSKPVASVTINQQQAQLSEGGLAYSFPNYFLREGANLLTAVATDAQGRVSSAAISVSVDQTAPILNVEYPRDGHVTQAAWVDVRGMVNDAVEAMFGSPEPQLYVSTAGAPERQAQVADRYFQLTEVPLRLGQNTLTVRAVDHLGNQRVQTIKVHRADTGQAGLLMVSGHNQGGAPNVELPQPLTVLALNAQGDPVAGQTVTFEVKRGTGVLSPTQGQTASGNANYTSRAIVATTDAEGKARAWYTIGRQAGPGANTVQAKASGLGGEDVQFTATTQKSAVARITADAGQNQISETGAQTMEILSAVVRDAHNNYVPGAKVQFKVEEGDASFADGTNTIIVTTDKNGMAAARPTTGNTAGIVRVSAQALVSETGNFEVPADTVGGAQYNIRVKQAQDGPASFGGIIYTDKGAPLAGVKVSIARTALLATSDAQGRFLIDYVPPGRIDLFVDGRTVNPQNDPARAQWPSLHFEAYVVRGQTNELPHAIYLPALLTSEARTVGGNEDVILTIPGLEGFQMKVKANSVTFPDGSRVGTLVVSPVTADKLPMAPPAGGAQFGVPAWTIQPSGTRFDPPIEVQMPNSTGEIPGDNLPVVQWDHDLGQYVPMGRATVTSDGAFLITDPGSGVTKAGWGGLCRYDECKTALTKCPDCQTLTRVGECLECRKDPRTDGQRLATVGGKVSIDTAPVAVLRKYLIPLGAFLEVKGSLAFSYAGDVQCCATGPGGRSAKVEGAGGAEMEAMIAVPLLPILKKFSSFIFSDITVGPSIVGKLSFGGSGSGSYDWCKRQGEATAKYVGAAELAISLGGGQFPVGLPNGGGTTGEFRPLDVGVVGQGEVSVNRWNASGLGGDTRISVDLFAKSQISIGALGWNFLDIRAPLIPDIRNEFSIVVPTPF